MNQQWCVEQRTIARLIDQLGQLVLAAFQGLWRVQRHLFIDDTEHAESLGFLPGGDALQQWQWITFTWFELPDELGPFPQRQ